MLCSNRLREIERFKRDPVGTQTEQYRRLVESGDKTAIGREHGISAGIPYAEFCRRMPIMEYADFAPYVERIRNGESGVTWNGRVGWFAKSSGTTSSKSKYIPVTLSGLNDSHMRGPKDIAITYSHLYPRSGVYEGKMLALGGSKKLEKEGDSIASGDLSSILIDRTPAIASKFRVPSKEHALIADFDQKVDYICRNATTQDVRSFVGVPSWNLVMMERVLDFTGKSNILEVWPNMELFTHGGMSFKPYKMQFDKLIPSPQMKYFETYNASEGFFGIAERPYTDEMLLMLDYGTFYEFLPTDSLDDHSRAVPLEGVKVGVDYALIITSTNGLWRYMLGDTVRFTSTSPYLFRVTGRTRLFVNAFGEEVIIDNAEAAMDRACRLTSSEIEEYTMAPIFMQDGQKGSHEWVVAFRRAPSDIDAFAEALDQALQQVNSDYEAKRRNNATLLRPTITVVPSGTFMELLRIDGRLGGQIKIPRLSSERTYVERLKALAADR